jgi:hypothetical protein
MTLPVYLPHEGDQMAKHWIKNALKNGRGKLHQHLGVAQGEKIPPEKLAAAKHSKNPTVRREAALAHTLSGMHKKKPETHSRSGMAHSLYNT